MAAEDWAALRHRLGRRIIRVADIVSILIADAVIIAIGFVLVRVATAYTKSGNPYFDAARNLSHAVFLVLYVAYVVLDLLDYGQDEYRRRKAERTPRESEQASAAERYP